MTETEDIHTVTSPSRDRIWIDGCFDFAHHGHAGAMLQARQLGKSLYVGVHSDEEILENKGPVVMTLPERVLAVEACKWATVAVPGAPYVTDPAVMDEYGCFYVVHGDDITTDANGEDCYRVVKEAGRFLIVKRTPNISTTDLVGRMLLCTKLHHIPTVKDASGIVKVIAASQALAGSKKSSIADSGLISTEAYERFVAYASAENGTSPRDGVYIWTSGGHLATIVAAADEDKDRTISLRRKMIYVDGGFDLFFAGHIEFLRLVAERAKLLEEPVGIVVGLHDDATVNSAKGLNYPIMSIFERALCVLQCKYVSHVVLQAPYAASKAFLDALPWEIVSVMHGPGPSPTSGSGTATATATGELSDPYKTARNMGLYEEISDHKYKGITTETIVERVTRNRGVYEERQRRKGWKAELEATMS
ncbi:uncharacterized protein V1516DRAFT_654995 [Lipomyces oligophaga]|uniref:uncharacterized protein n=1 Tax=Lipomyces oligophaga TaxID=45792 RepID=UPI0034CF9453